MTISIFRPTVFLTVFTLGAIVSATASAATMFTVTDLGSGMQADRNASGDYDGVTGSTGLSYAFDKAYVNFDDSVSSDTSSAYRVWARNDFGSIGYSVTYINKYQTSVEGGDIHWTLSDNRPPAEDFNKFGQVVGSSQMAYTGTFGPESWQYATFSDLDFKSHSGATAFAVSSTDNLNHYIASDLGIYLFMAFLVDDKGRIISEGVMDDQVHFFLLSPNGLATNPIPNPEPTPEPSTLAFLIVGLSALATRTNKENQDF